jgi:hypothetical protein
MRYTSLFAAAAASLVSASAFAADFNVSMATTDAGVFEWNVNGELNPQIDLARGHTYTFAINAPGHPFDIKTAQVTGTGMQFDAGVSQQGVTSGTMTFNVPTDPSTPPLFYQCEVHATMTGPLQLVSSIPAMTRVMTGLIALVLCVGGLFAVRMRRRTS